jgi:hypothetical protein
LRQAEGLVGQWLVGPTQQHPARLGNRLHLHVVEQDASDAATSSRVIEAKVERAWSGEEDGPPSA